MSADWYVTIRFRVNNLVEHSEPDAENIARDVIKEETIAGICEDDYDILVLEKITP